MQMIYTFIVYEGPGFDTVAVWAFLSSCASILVSLIDIYTAKRLIKVMKEAKIFDTKIGKMLNASISSFGGKSNSTFTYAVELEGGDRFEVEKSYLLHRTHALKVSFV